MEEGPYAACNVPVLNLRNSHIALLKRNSHVQCHHGLDEPRSYVKFRTMGSDMGICAVHKWRENAKFGHPFIFMIMVRVEDRACDLIFSH